jgi:hypothetical protein
MQIEKLIASLLQKHGNVFIPGLGELAVNKENTKLEGTQMMPGNTSLILNTFSDNSDGLLLHSFSKEFDCTIEEAPTKLSNAINEIQLNLNAGKSISIPGYGYLTKNGDSIVFQQEKHHLLPNHFFGLHVLEVQNSNKNIDLYNFTTKPVETQYDLNKSIIKNTEEEIIEEEILENTITIEESIPIIEPEPIKSIFEDEQHVEINSVNDIQTIPQMESPLNRIQSEYVASPRHANTSNASSKLKWGTVAGLVALFLILSFISAWVYATLKCNKMLGLSPIWDNGCQKTPSLAANSVKVEGTKSSDSAINNDNITAESAPQLAAQKPISTPKTVNAPTKEPMVEKPKEIAKPIAQPVVSKPIAKVEKPVEAKPEVQKPIIEKPKEIKKAESKPIEKPKMTENKVSEKTKVKEESKMKITDISKETSKVSEKPKTEKVEKPIVENKPKVVREPKVVVKPMPKVPMSASYKKGMTYLCFGTFKNPTVAKKLKSDLRGIGVVTETVEIDGTYRVVIPYTNRKFAETAAEDYPNTIIFE